MQTSSFVSITLLVLALSVGFCHGQQLRGIVGKPAPSWGVSEWINLPEGKTTLDIADYRGKVVYLYGFQSWCPGCHSRGFPALQKIASHYDGNDEVAVVAVQTVFEGFSTNTATSAWETAKKYNLQIPVGHDGNDGVRSVLMGQYRTGGTPWTIIIDREGVVRFNDFHLRPELAIARIDRLRMQKPAEARQSTATTTEVVVLPADRGVDEVIGTRPGRMQFDGLLDSSGKRVAERRRAKATLMRWWTDACPYCEATLPGIETLRRRYEKAGLRVVGVYHPKPPDEVKDTVVRAHANRLGYRGEVGLDFDWSELKRAMGGLSELHATSVTVLLDERGVVRWAHPGPVLFPSEDPSKALENSDFQSLERAVRALVGPTKQ